eukprot:COSAG01_NODE_9_length_43729_cov_66.133463_17_plen_284_part_00
MKSLTPYGVSDFVPEETAAFQEKLQAVQHLFEQQHYENVKTPTLEYYDTLSTAMGPFLKEQAIKFVDRSGHLLILRPDHTTPIARLAATRMADAKRPLKLSYYDAVFRLKKDNYCDAVERFQIGAECIGIAGTQAELDIILLCMRSLEAMGLDDLCLVLGHVSFTQDLSDTQRQALIDKDYTVTGQLPEQGGPELFADFPDLQTLTTSLTQQLQQSRVIVNKGLVHGLYYYTGLIFEVYIKGVAAPIATGGRYDKLLGKFAADEPAVGFGIDLTLISELGDAS